MKPQAFQLDRFLERRPEPQEARMLGAGTELNPLMKLAATSGIPGMAVSARPVDRSIYLM